VVVVAVKHPDLYLMRSRGGHIRSWPPGRGGGAVGGAAAKCTITRSASTILHITGVNRLTIGLQEPGAIFGKVIKTMTWIKHAAKLGNLFGDTSGSARYI